MILALDVETDKLPPKGAALGSPEFPWPVQIAALLFGFDGHNRAVFSSRIRADGRSIGAGAQQVHGISTREASRTGVPEVVALGVVCAYAAEARYLVGYNVDFDRAVLESALIRLGKDTRKLCRPGLQVVDLMRPSTPFCKLRGEAAGEGYKWPRLGEALEKIRHQRPRHALHDALRDAAESKRLFLSLHHRGALDLEAA